MRKSEDKTKYGLLIETNRRLQEVVQRLLIAGKELKQKNEELLGAKEGLELRTPLTAIKEGIDIVLDGSAGQINEEQKDFLETAKRNVDRLARLINNILDFQLDLMLPAGGGINALKNIRGAPHTANIPVVVLTGMQDAAYKKNILEQGVEAYLEKPYDAQELIKTIRSILVK